MSRLIDADDLLHEVGRIQNSAGANIPRIYKMFREAIINAETEYIKPDEPELVTYDEEMLGRNK